jgi:hypothetical protein
MTGRRKNNLTASSSAAQSTLPPLRLLQEILQNRIIQETRLIGYWDVNQI